MLSWRKRRRRPRLLCIWGTRPEAIKMAPVVRALRSCRGVQLATCVTAQHRRLLDQALRSFSIRPDYDLDLMRPDQTVEETIRHVLGGLTRVLKKESPDLVLVQGDTATTLAAALAAFYQNIPSAHVEAGLRTWDPRRPFPEEIQRVLTDRLASLHLAPTPQARRNLLREGLGPGSIFVTGNTVVDAARLILPQVGRPEVRSLERIFDGEPVLLATLHRRESFGRPLHNICRGLQLIVERHPVRILFPVHPNPVVQRTVRSLFRHERIHLTPPLNYHDFQYAMSRCALILTDSGGIQEEAPEHHKHVLVLRDVTERPEALWAGFAELAGTEPEVILRRAGKHIKHPRAPRSRGISNPFGDGRAGERIAKAVLHHFGLGPRPRDWKGLRPPDT